MTVMMRFKLKENRTAWFEPKAAIFPGNQAPIIHVAEDGERMLEEAFWGFVRLPKGRAPGRVTNVRNDTVLTNRFWTDSFRRRRCLVPFSSYCEPLGMKPASWWWHALKAEGDERPLGAFPGIWKDYEGPIRKDGEKVSQRVFAFMTCGPNSLESAQAHERMPVLLYADSDFDTWLYGSEAEALALAKPYPAEALRIVQKGSARKDLLGQSAA
jgi:putative SOS response-associated peptidase YedK